MSPDVIGCRPGLGRAGQAMTPGNRNLDYALRARTAGRSAGVGRRNALAGTVTTATVLPAVSFSAAIVARTAFGIGTASRQSISQLRPGGDLDENRRATISTPPVTSTLQAARNWLFTRQSHQRTTSSAPTRLRQRLVAGKRGELHEC